MVKMPRDRRDALQTGQKYARNFRQEPVSVSNLRNFEGPKGVFHNWNILAGPYKVPSCSGKGLQPLFL